MLTANHTFSHTRPREAARTLKRTLQEPIAEFLQSSLWIVGIHALQQALKGKPSELLQSSLPKEAAHA